MAKASDRRVIVLSVHSKYVHAILRGEKRVEFRKNGVPVDIEQIVLYSTAPDQAVLGYVPVKECVIAAPRVLWEQFGNVGGIDNNAFGQYFHGCRRAKCYVLGHPSTLLNPMRISQVGLKIPPQSFAYVDRLTWRRIKKRKLTNQALEATS